MHEVFLEEFFVQIIIVQNLICWNLGIFTNVVVIKSYIATLIN